MSEASRPIPPIAGEAPAPRAWDSLCAGRAPEKQSSSDRATLSAPRKPPTKSKQKAGPGAGFRHGEQRRLRGCGHPVLTVPFEGQAALLKQLKPAIRPGSILIDATVRLPPQSADAPHARSASGKAPPPNKPPNSCPKE
jgi:hypothetical protein